MARQTLAALRLAGHEVELAARLRSYDGNGDVERQARLGAIGGRLAQRYVHRLYDRPLAERPQAWITYHLYHKAPDWIGPRVTTKLGIPYVVIEASVAAKRAGGPWSLGHEASIAALARAAAVISLNPADEPGIAPHVADRQRLHRLKPFLDSRPYARAVGQRALQRTALARRYGLDPSQPWILAVAMMRPGDKLDSYKLLAEALSHVQGKPWSLLVVGDGPAKGEVRAGLAPLGERVVYTGALDDAVLPEIYAAADLYVWPAVKEAFGMAILEAQAAGLPVIAGDSGGVAGIVRDGHTGAVVAPRDAAALAAAMTPLLDDPGRRQAFSRAALATVAAEHDLSVASRSLDAILARAVQTRVQA